MQVSGGRLSGREKSKGKDTERDKEEGRAG